ncbi:hypothetical protein [Saccharopolyspora taberi]|uniref:Uncharacterized protein n=1 Tax=Saccharopolyspora taberi TaxID=60895 RepID=A0ABN3V6U6_9PSEU
MGWERLPPGAVPEIIQIKSGKTFTVYRVPMPCEGPEVRQAADGRSYLVYMYACFVFRWFRGESRVRIYAGHIDQDFRWPLPWELNIEDRWDREALVGRARDWVRSHRSRFESNQRRR